MTFVKAWFVLLAQCVGLARAKFSFSVFVDDSIFIPNTKGRVILYISKNNDTAPLTQGDDNQQTCQVSLLSPLSSVSLCLYTHLLLL